MLRRDFLKTTMLLAAVSIVAGKGFGIFNNAIASSGAFPDEGPKYLGFQLDSKFKPTKICGTCKYFKENKEVGTNAGECLLPTMKSAVKRNKNADHVWVRLNSYCNMWQKKA